MHHEIKQIVSKVVKIKKRVSYLKYASIVLLIIGFSLMCLTEYSILSSAILCISVFLTKIYFDLKMNLYNATIESIEKEYKHLCEEDLFDCIQLIVAVLD